jgi:hypothetical protein
MKERYGGEWCWDEMISKLSGESPLYRFPLSIAMLGRCVVFASLQGVGYCKAETYVRLNDGLPWRVDRCLESKGYAGTVVP